MVCVPCIILPILLAIYLKFIQPLILRFLPERWVHILDPILYPTCPVQVPPPSATPSAPPAEDDDVKNSTTCCGGEESETKKTK